VAEVGAWVMAASCVLGAAPGLGDRGHHLRPDPHPMTVWFHACWMFATPKHGVSALGLQKVLEVGCCETA
jgi:hypothetical protein